MYKQAVGADGAWSEPQPLTGADTQHRFADGVVDAKFNRLVAVREDHSGEGEPVNSVCTVGERPLQRLKAMCCLCAPGLSTAHSSEHMLLPLS